ncbi:MAG TPA: DUF6677 family protein [Thermoanaerobaculia bacterium]|nr:DUF6677 family protein [Thermoanaerobaculia bacterium]
MAESGSSPASPPESKAVAYPQGNVVVAVLSAWLVPGLGHIYLKRRLRGIAFFVLVIVSVLVGCRLQGNLYQVVRGQPLSILATLGSMGMGFPYFLLRYGLHYQGDIMGAGYEYGTAFLLTGGLMNLLLILDAWDIVRGKKE